MGEQSNACPSLDRYVCDLGFIVLRYKKVLLYIMKKPKALSLSAMERKAQLGPSAFEGGNIEQLLV